MCCQACKTCLNEQKKTGQWFPLERNCVEAYRMCERACWRWFCVLLVGKFIPQLICFANYIHPKQNERVILPSDSLCTRDNCFLLCRWKEIEKAGETEHREKCCYSPTLTLTLWMCSFAQTKCTLYMAMKIKHLN